MFKKIILNAILLLFVGLFFSGQHSTIYSVEPQFLENLPNMNGLEAAITNKTNPENNPGKSLKVYVD